MSQTNKGRIRKMSQGIVHVGSHYIVYDMSVPLFGHSETLVEAYADYAIVFAILSMSKRAATNALP